MNLLRKTLDKELEQAVSEHCQRYLRRGPRRYCPSLQPSIAEEEEHRDRALKAVQSVEKGNQNRSGRLWAFLLFELSSLSGNERVQVKTGADKSYRYTYIVKALRDTCSRWRCNHDDLLEPCTQRPYTTVSSVQASKSRVMTAVWVMMNTTLLLAHGLCTVSGRKPTKTTRPGMTLIGKRIPGLGSRSCLRNSHTMLRRFSGWSAAGERDDNTDAVQSLQQPVVAANAAEHASRRTWTHARRLMDEVYRNRGYYPTNAHGPLTGNGKRKGKAEERVAKAQEGHRQRTKNKDERQGKSTFGKRGAI